MSVAQHMWRRCSRAHRGTLSTQLLLLRSFSSSSEGRNFWQRLNEQHLAHELRNLSESGHETAHPDGTVTKKLFDPKIRLRQNRRLQPAPVEIDHDGNWRASSSSSSSSSSPSSRGTEASGTIGESVRKGKPWLEYESLRGDTYPDDDLPSSSSSSGQNGPRRQDLTHDEAQRLQEMYMRKRMLERKIMWLKRQDLPNPQKEAKMTMRRQKEEAEQAQKVVQGDGPVMYPPPYLDTHPESRRLLKMEEAARLEEMESRFRTRIREEKLANARIVKAPAPKIGEALTDPIQRHVERRMVRQRVKLQYGLEEALTANSAQILYEHLNGVAVSIVKVKATSPRATQNIFYNLTSDHDPAWVQRQLDILAPKLRSQVALSVNLGMTPALRFIPHIAGRENRRKALWPMARAIQEEIPLGGGGPRPFKPNEGSRSADFGSDSVHAPDDLETQGRRLSTKRRNEERRLKMEAAREERE